MKYLITSLFFFSSLLAQLDQIFFKDGKILKGEVILDGESISLKKRFSDKLEFYHTDFVNTIKSWNGDLIYPRGVILNKNSEKYHLPNVEHIQIIDPQQFFESRKDADKVGFSPCKACFKTTPKIPDYYLEKDLVKELVRNIRINHEILYEHPDLNKLTNMTNEVLSKWPEKLKGYDYRVHIIKDEMINAFAVPGGNLYFNTGLLDVIEDDQELESVLAHEIAHVERRHGLRQFKKAQQRQLIKDAAVVLTAVAAIATENQNLALAAQTVNIIGEVALEILKKGYSRDLEQESDIMAQIYFENSNKDKQMMISLLDKLATNTVTQQGFISPTDAYGSHPNIVKRIEQIKHAERIKYEENLMFEIFPLGTKTIKGRSKAKSQNIKDDLDKYEILPKFINFEISNVFIQPSSDKNEEFVFLLIGEVYNNHEYVDFEINDIQLNFLGSLGVTPLNGIVDLIIPSQTSVDFTAEINCDSSSKDALVSNFKEKNILPFAMKMSAVVLEPGKNPTPLKGLSNFNSSMTVY